MSTSKPTLTRLSEITPGQQADFFAVLVDRNRGLTREGKPYFHCRFADLRRTVSFMAWGDDAWYARVENEWRPGMFYKLRALYSEHDKYGPQIELLNIRPVRDEDGEQGFDPAQLVESSPHDPEVLLGELRTLATKHIGNHQLRQLVLKLLEKHAGVLTRLPASRDRAFAYRGGWVEHTVNVTRTAIDLIDRYAMIYPDLQPPLNRDLVTAGAILHDLGKVLEFGEESPVPSVTLTGKLTGTLVLGRDLLREAIGDIPDLHPELLLLLEHLMLTPLYTPEHTGPRWPLIPEGLLIQYADDLDQKMAQYIRCLTRDTGPGPFTERDPVLGRQLLKTREV